MGVFSVAALGSRAAGQWPDASRTALGSGAGAPQLLLAGIVATLVGIVFAKLVELVAEDLYRGLKRRFASWLARAQRRQ
jgi:hypothetical protein